jgi:hypothetical protein
MVRLVNFSGQFPRIQLDQCGLLFLATPHSGTTEATWNQLILAIADTVVSVRLDRVKLLEAFNPASVSDKENFFNLKPCPHYRCLAEGKKTTIINVIDRVVSLPALESQQDLQRM